MDREEGLFYNAGGWWELRQDNKLLMAKRDTEGSPPILTLLVIIRHQSQSLTLIEPAQSLSSGTASPSGIAATSHSHMRMHTR